MKIITGTPGSGKTTLLIERAAATGETIVCGSGERKDLVIALAKRLGYEIPTPISYFDFLERRYSMGETKGFLVDDLDEFFAKVSPHRVVSAVTVTTLKNQPRFLSKEVIENHLNLISLSNETLKGTESLGGEERELLDKAMLLSGSKTSQVKGMK